MLPGARRCMAEKHVWHRFALVSQVLDGIGQIGRIPVYESGDHEVGPGNAELLRFVGAIGDAALFERADDPGQSVALLSLVQTGLATLA